MNAKEIKSFIVNTLGLKSVRVNTGKSKRPFINACIPSERQDIGQLQKLIYKEEFPIIFRQLSLKSIYGQDCKFAENGNAGNVHAHSISMHAHEWEQAISQWNTLKDKFTSAVESVIPSV